MAALNLTINTVLDSKPINVPFVVNVTTVEDVCIYVCKLLNIGPTARHLFGLRTVGKQLFLHAAATFRKSQTFDFRFRFKVSSIERLSKVDSRAYDYFFHQVRGDVMNNKVPDIVYEKYRQELIGLGITDMYRVMLEKDIPRETVESEYKKYIPKEVIKRHAFFVKRPIHETLGKLQKSSHDASFVRLEYLRLLDDMAPDYLAEQYKCTTDLDGCVISIIVKYSPHHPTEPGLKYYQDTKRDQWQLICTIDDLVFVSVRNDNTVEICRKNGIPFYLRFSSMITTLSFVSLLDGYYRLTCKWTFNVCRVAQTPSLQRLYAMRFHGPIGGEFAYAKLEEKRANRHGCFIVRESETQYNHYYVDVCMSNGMPKTFRLERINDEELIFNDDVCRYKTIPQLIAAYNNPKGAIYLHECLPPSEYDKSPLLLCQSEKLNGECLTDTNSVDLPKVPLCINCKNLQIFKGYKKEGVKGFTVVYRCMWKVTKDWKIEAAMKMVKNEFCDSYLKDFLTLGEKYAFLQCKSIVRYYGLSIASCNVAYITEYFRLGPLNVYLEERRGIIKTVDLIEATSHLAAALWHLKENGIVHGNIRCKKLMVAAHDESTFSIKLVDPGLFNSYASNEIHWIPIECYGRMELARYSSAADVWAFATTLWEMFMFGETPLKNVSHSDAVAWYSSIGKRLPQPPNCPDSIYMLMLECWEADPYHRKQPQAIMRDINQLLYQVYDSRRNHSYATVMAPSTPTESINTSTSSNLERMSGASTNSLYSQTTDSTFVTTGMTDDLISVSSATTVSVDSCSIEDVLPLPLTPLTTSTIKTPQNNVAMDQEQQLPHLVNHFNHVNTLYRTNSLVSSSSSSCDLSNILSTLDFNSARVSASLATSSLDAMECVFELDDDYNVILQGRIGQGFYGEVYKGTLEYIGGTRPGIMPQQVAVKRLKATANSYGPLQDFEREISIMKALQHPNIVQILGVLRDPEISLVMEYVEQGSLLCHLKINRERLHTKQLLRYGLDIAKGMAYLGHKNIVHRDLAARNILVVDNSHVKISDFGLAQVTGSNDYYILKTNRELPIKWYAPESLRDGKFSVRSDVWSYGVTMCEMFNYGEEPKLSIEVMGLNDGASTSTAHQHRNAPLKNAVVSTAMAGEEQQSLLHALDKGVRFPCTPQCPQAVYIRIIYPCWHADPHKRHGFHQIIHETDDLLSQY